jgi:amino acid transporter/mannitol/fructose-specific phosphotransferase system IIA component (Ntr-type)
MILAYFIAGLLALTGLFSQAELVSAMPKAGGDYFFISRSIGPLAGTVSSFLSWTALCLKSAFAIFGIAEMLYLSFGIPVIYSSLIVCCFFTGLNIFGTKESVRFQVVLVLALFAIMLAVVLGGISKISFSHFSPALPHGLNSVLITSGFVFISFGGLLNIASISEEVKDPLKNIPRGILLALICVTAVYTLILVVVVGILPPDVLSGSLTPVAKTGQILFGKIGAVIVSIGAVLAFVTTANAGILSASRYPLALSKDNLLPSKISMLSKQKKVPYVAVLITGIFILLCLLLELDTMVKLGSIVILTLYALTNIAVIVLREGRIQNYKPGFQVPFYPWINLASIVLFVFMIIDMGLVAVEISLGLLALASAVYFFYGRKRHSIDYALLHLIERIIDKKMSSRDLEDELKQVIINRDDLKIDRFHRLAEDAFILNIEEHLGLDDFLEKLADKIAPKVGLSDKNMIELFKQRESEGSTAVTPFVAIPHIIIPGANNFKLVVVRCAKGIKFNQDHDAVKAVFMLFGTNDERTFHLKVLAAIAAIVNNKDFEKKWLQAKDCQQIRHLILLGERSR